MITIREILLSFQSSLLTELENQGLAEWSIASTGSNLKETFTQLSSEDIHDLLNDIYEGLPLKITLDLSNQLAYELEEILRMRNLTSGEDLPEDED